MRDCWRSRADEASCSFPSHFHCTSRRPTSRAVPPCHPPSHGGELSFESVGTIRDGHHIIFAYLWKADFSKGSQ